MSKVQQKGKRGPPAARRGDTGVRRAGTRWPLVVAAATAALVVLIAVLVVRSGGSGGALTVPPGPDKHSLLVDPANAKHLFYGNHTGLHESLDGGSAWQPVAGLAGADAMALALGSKGKLGTLHVAGHDVYFRSDDGGKSFAPVRLDLPGADIHAFASAPSNPRIVYAFVVGFGINKSEDAGQTWKTVAPQGSVDPGQSVMALAVDPKDPNVLLAGTMSSGYFRSEDGGRTWEQGPIRAAITSISFAGEKADTIYAAAPLQGLHRSTDGGKSWAVVLSEPTFLVATAPSEPRRVYAVLQDGSLKVSEDGANSWK